MIEWGWGEVSPRSPDDVKRALAALVFADLSAIEAAIDRFRAEKGRLPDALDEIARDLPDGEIPRDPLDGEYLYRRESVDRYVVIFLGGDGELGGDGVGSDWSRASLSRSGLLPASR